MCGCGQLAETAGAGLPPGRPLGDAHGRWGRRLQTGGCVRWAAKFELGAVCKRRAAGRAGARRPCKASPWCGAAADLPGSRGQVQREGGRAGWENIREAAGCWRGRRARMRRTGCGALTHRANLVLGSVAPLAGRDRASMRDLMSMATARLAMEALILVSAADQIDTASASVGCSTGANALGLGEPLVERHPEAHAQHGVEGQHRDEEAGQTVVRGAGRIAKAVLVVCGRGGEDKVRNKSRS